MTISVYAPRSSSFISIQLFVLNLFGWFGVFSNKFILHYYTLIIDLRLSIILCLSSSDIYLYLDNSLSFLVVTVSDLFCCGFFWAFVILLAILLPIKSPAVSAVFWIALFETGLNASAAGCLAWSRNFWLYSPLRFYLYFYQYFYPYLLQKSKIHSHSKIFDL